MHANKTQVRSMGRLKKRSDFLRVQSCRKRWVSKGIILQVGAGETGKLRYGITVSKRVSKLAVTRNRIKRRLRAVACDVLPLHAKVDTDYVLIGKLEVETRPYSSLQKDLIRCLENLNLQQSKL